MVEDEIDSVDLMKEVVEVSGSETVDVVVEHELKGVTPEMIDWWWDHIDNTERYKLWHRDDHFSFEWEVPPSKHGHIGAIQIVVEKFGDTPPLKMRIRYDDLTSAPISTTYSHAGAASIIDHDDKPLIRFVHEYETESYGTRMRSTFRLPAKMPQFILDGLHKHNEEEMGQFPKFLQELYKQRE